MFSMFGRIRGPTKEVPTCQRKSGSSATLSDLLERLAKFKSSLVVARQSLARIRGNLCRPNVRKCA